MEIQYFPFTHHVIMLYNSTDANTEHASIVDVRFGPLANSLVSHYYYFILAPNNTTFLGLICHLLPCFVDLCFLPV